MKERSRVSVNIETRKGTRKEQEPKGRKQENVNEGGNKEIETRMRRG